MKETTLMCNCQSECQTNRCDCLKEGKACSDQCKCSQCKNPFNSIENAEQLYMLKQSEIKPEFKAKGIQQAAKILNCLRIGETIGS